MMDGGAWGEDYTSRAGGELKAKGKALCFLLLDFMDLYLGHAKNESRGKSILRDFLKVSLSLSFF